MDGVDTSTTFTDNSYAGANSPHTVTAYGNAQIDTAQSKFGGASGLFDGTGDYLSTPDSADWNFGSGNFTIDFHIRRNGVQANNNGIIGATSTPSQAGWTIYWPSNTNKVSGFSLTSTGTIAGLTWTHVAFVRSGNILTVYLNGTASGTLDVTSQTFNSGGSGLAVGRYYANYEDYYFKGWSDECRISKGVARWTSNFTPPTRAYSYLDKEVLGVADANIGAISFGGSDILEANIRDIIYA
jgi:hypothetical protein